MGSIKNDKLSVFKRLYETNISQLTQFACRYTNDAVALDIVQDVFFELWKTHKVLIEKTARSYLFTAVRNRCINYLKQEQMKRSFTSQSQINFQLQQLNYFDSAEKTFIDKEQLQMIYNEIELLPEKCKKIFKLSYYKDKKNQEIAEILNLSIRTVEHQLYLGLKTLRSRLSKNGLLFYLFIIKGINGFYRNDP